MKKNVIIFFLIFQMGCKYSNKTPEKVKSDITKIKIENILSDKINIIDLKDLLDSVSYINLETNSYNLVGAMSDIANQRMRISRQHILFDSYIFGKNGDYIGRIGSKGNGPGEYSAIRGITIDEQKDRVIIYDHWKHNILCYDYKGNFISKIKDTLKTYQSDLFYIGNNKLLFFSPDQHPVLKIRQYDLTSGKADNLLEIDFSQTVTSKNFYFPPYPNWQIYSIDDTVHFMIEFPANTQESDYIYFIKGNSAIPKYKFELGELKQKKVFSSKHDIDKKAYIHVLGESTQYLFFRCYIKNGKDKTIIHSVYNKSNNILNRLSFSNNLISNLILSRMIIRNDSMFSFIYPFEIDKNSINHFNALFYGDYRKNKSEFISLSQKINDNPILIISKLK